MTVRIPYGAAASQFGDLTRRAGDGTPPVVVLVHGGFWRVQYGLDLMEPLAQDLVQRGYAVWNIEYRRLGEPGGGWPGTFEDVATAIDVLAGLEPEQRVDLDRVAIVGHSAGGHLALWAAGRSHLVDGDPGARPEVLPLIAIGLGPVSDLRAAAEAGLGGGAVVELLDGMPEDYSDRYDVATPAPPPAGVRIVVVRGERDLIVPAEFTVPPGGDVETDHVAGDDHFDLIDPDSDSWQVVVTALAEAFGSGEGVTPTT